MIYKKVSIESRVDNKVSYLLLDSDSTIEFTKSVLMDMLNTVTDLEHKLIAEQQAQNAAKEAVNPVPVQTEAASESNEYELELQRDFV